MGGKVFPGQSKPVTPEMVSKVVNYLNDNVFSPEKCERFSVVGSSLVKKESGDIDVVVEIPSEDFSRVIRRAVTVLGRENVKTRGSVLHFLCGKENTITGVPHPVQVDVFLTDDLEGTSWLMTGQRSESSVPAVYRNLLLSFLAKNSRTSTQRYTLGFPKGLTTYGNDSPDETTTDSFEILNVLRLPVDPSEVTSFEDLVDVLEREDLLPSLPWDYISSYREKDPIGHEKAIRYLKDAILRRDGRRFTTKRVHRSDTV